MKIYIDQQPMDIYPGMTVRHALIHAGILKDGKGPIKVYDEWGNEMGLDGALSEGMKITVRMGG